VDRTAMRTAKGTSDGRSVNGANIGLSSHGTTSPIAAESETTSHLGDSKRVAGKSTLGAKANDDSAKLCGPREAAKKWYAIGLAGHPEQRSSTPVVSCRQKVGR